MLVLGDRVGDVHALPVPDLSGGRRLLFGHTATVVTDVVRTTTCVCVCVCVCVYIYI